MSFDILSQHTCQPVLQNRYLYSKHMNKLKLLFLVNGEEKSAAGVRAKMFAQRLPSEWDVLIKYRTPHKLKSILQFINAAREFKPDIVYVMDTGYSGVLAGYITKKLVGNRLITDTGDVTYVLALSEGIYSKIQLALINWVEQIALKKSDFLIVRGSYHKEWLAEKGIRNVIFVPDGVDTKAVRPIQVASLKSKFGIGDNLVIGLLGTMIWSKRHQMCYGWDVVEAMALLKDKPVKALLVGDGDGRAILESRAQVLGVSHKIIFTGYIPYENLPQYLSMMDVCISTQSNDLVGKVRTTGKLPLYLAYGKYVIATDVGEATKVLPSVGCLLPYTGVRDSAYPIRLVEQIDNLIQNPQLLEVKQDAIQTAKENFDYEMLAEKVQNLCLTVAKKQRSKILSLVD
jgi:glycosyltransferase involved in cell wall biosynthesis